MGGKEGWTERIALLVYICVVYFLVGCCLVGITFSLIKATTGGRKKSTELVGLDLLQVGTNY